jgi:hypothetical protein
VACLGHHGGELHHIAGMHNRAVGPFDCIAPVGAQVYPKEGGAAARNGALNQPAMLRVRPGLLSDEASAIAQESS